MWPAGKPTTVSLRLEHSRRRVSRSFGHGRLRGMSGVGLAAAGGLRGNRVEEQSGEHCDPAGSAQPNGGPDQSRTPERESEWDFRARFWGYLRGVPDCSSSSALLCPRSMIRHVKRRRAQVRKAKHDQRRGEARKLSRAWQWCALVIALVFTAGVRGHLLDVPLERDEGEYAYVAQLLLDGVAPYTQAYSMKLPGIYAAYAVMLGALGQTHSAIHLGLLFVNAITILLVFFLAREWLDPPGAAAGAAAFALLSLGRPVAGLFANAEHFVLPFAIGGLILICRTSRNAKPWWLLTSGVLLGIGIVMKQHGVAFAACGLLFAWLLGAREDARKVRATRIGWMALGITLPYAATCLTFAAFGAFEEFWFWTVKYASAYTSQIELSIGMSNLGSAVAALVRAAPLIWFLVLAGVVAIWLSPRTRENAPIVLAFAGLSFLSTCPGLFFRPHYFLLALPAAGVLLGATFQWVTELGERRISAVAGFVVAIALTLAALGDALLRQGPMLFRMTPVEVARYTYGANPFPEALELGDYLRDHSDPTDRIAVVGSEPQILFYAHRRSATPYIYMYPMMDIHDYALTMQQEMISGIEAAKPRFLVVVRSRASWLTRQGSHLGIFDWLAEYQDLYHPLGVAEILSQERTRYRWGEEVRWPPSSETWIALMERIEQK